MQTPNSHRRCRPGRAVQGRPPMASTRTVAVLVRPDRHIAWRSAGAAADATATLEHVVAQMLALNVEDRRIRVASRANRGSRRVG